MAKLLNLHYRSIIVSCLLFNAAVADISCQDGVDYKNSCNPYKAEFIHLHKYGAVGNDSVNKKKLKHKQWFSRSYLNTLLDKYSKNYDGRSGLQALIDRSQYGKGKTASESQKQPEKERKATTTQNTLTVKKSLKEDVSLASVKKEKIPSLNVSLVQNSKSKDIEVNKSITTLESKESKSAKPIKVSTLVEVNISKNESEKRKVVTKEKTSLSKGENLATTKVHKQTPAKKNTLTKKHGSVRKVVTKKKKVQKIKLASYKIKKGDTLSTVAATIGISLKKLKSINHLERESTIKIGKSLKIPQHLANKVKELEELRAAKAKKIAIQKANEKKIAEQIKKGYYIVQKGDTLSQIAKKIDLSINQLREYNRIARSQKIKVGNKLLLKEPKIVRKKSRSLNYVKNIKFKHAPSFKYKRKIRVIATAYTSHRRQTDNTPFLAAWNNRIRPGMKIIAVSVDLIRKYGLTNGVKVKIMGLPGYYVVRDKMNKRLRNHIDIYMGINRRKALHWGRRRVALYW